MALGDQEKLKITSTYNKLVKFGQRRLSLHFCTTFALLLLLYLSSVFTDNNSSYLKREVYSDVKKPVRCAISLRQWRSDILVLRSPVSGGVVLY
jgi:hypothetical protein